MKTILLRFKNDTANLKPRRFTVVRDYEDGSLDVAFVNKFRDGSSLTDRFSLAKQEDGSYRNQNGCEYVKAKVDRRPKPYSVRYNGVDGTETTKFATLTEVQNYVKARWEGWDYTHGFGDFHTDYSYYVLSGCSLLDLGHAVVSNGSEERYPDWAWNDLNGK